MSNFLVIPMAQGKSGRIVIQIDPALKNKLYVELVKRQLTMKDWFIENAIHFIEEKKQALLWESNTGTSREQR